MWKTTVVLQAFIALGFSALAYGPCHHVTTVPLGLAQYAGRYFVNVMTKNLGARCIWADRALEWEGGVMPEYPTVENTLIGVTLNTVENNTIGAKHVQGRYVATGHYRFESKLTPGNSIVFEAYWMKADLPQLDCHYICSNDSRLANERGAFYCESASPDALASNACEIKKIATENNFDIDDLQIVDNCDCPNVPFRYESNCETMSLQEYFKDCP